MQTFATWLANELSGKDLVVIGFWSDWAYLTDLFVANLTAVGPRSVYVINPDRDEELRQKAPQLWAWANGPNIQFHHIRLSGEVFLDELRRIWSGRFISRLMEAARPAYEALFGPPQNEVLALTQLRGHHPKGGYDVPHGQNRRVPLAA